MLRRVLVSGEIRCPEIPVVDEVEMRHARTVPEAPTSLQPSSTTVGRRRFRMVDRVFELRTSVMAFLPVMDHLFAPFACAGSDPPSAVYEVREFERPADRRRYEARKDGETVGRVSSIGLLVDLLVRETTNEVVSEATRYIAIHAAAAARDGRAVVMPAPPGQGKTTMVAALVHHGWDFLTDEAVLISTADGLVHPFPRPLSISPGSMRLLPGLRERIPAPTTSYRHYDHHVAPDDLRPGCVSGPVPIGGVVFPRYAPGAATALEPIPRAGALLDLLKGTFNLDALGGKGVETLARIVGGVPCYRLRIGGLASAVDEIQRSHVRTWTVTY